MNIPLEPLGDDELVELLHKMADELSTRLQFAQLQTEEEKAEQ